MIENKETALEAKPAKKKIADKRRKKKLTIEERRAINAAKPARNKYMAAFEKFQGSIMIYDPAFML